MTSLDVLFERGAWKEARRLLRKELKNKPDSHWAWTRLASTYYEERKYEKALQLSERAMELAPHCPLVLWDYACALDMAGRPKEAIAVWKRLLGRGVEQIAYEECGEGIRWARSLLNDCRYRIGWAYRELGDLSAASRYLHDHLANRSPGIPSLYPRAEVQEQLASLQTEVIPAVSRGPLTP